MLLVFLATDAGFEFVLGAFAAGLVVGLVLESPEGKVVRMRLEGIGYGFLIPVYFVVTGMNFDIDSLLTAEGLALAALFLGVLLVDAGNVGAALAAELGARETASLALFGATALPLIVAIVGIAHERGDISKAVAASLVGAGMISVLVYPSRCGDDGGRLDTPSRSRVNCPVATRPLSTIRPGRLLRRARDALPRPAPAEGERRDTVRHRRRSPTYGGGFSTSTRATSRSRRRRVVRRAASSAPTRPSSTGSPQGS